MPYPLNPTTGDEYILGSKTWKYNGSRWVKLGLSQTVSADVAFSDLTSKPSTLAGYGITDGATSVPAGMIMPHTTATEPAGWLECDGAAVSRSTYSALFAVISDDYGAGDGSTTFNLPDLRGEFIRGFANSSANDADRAGRTNRGDGTTGDVVGSKQSDAIRNMTGAYGSIVGWHTSSYSVSGVYFTGSSGSYITNGSYGSGGHVHFNASRQVPTGSDNRPTNVQMMYCIKI